jgi:hypothetical protein
MAPERKGIAFVSGATWAMRITMDSGLAESTKHGGAWILEPSATGLCEPDLHVFAKLFEGRQERGLETQAFGNSSAWQHSLRS